MLSERDPPFLQIAYEFFELLDSQSSANEDLHAARVADKIRFAVLVRSLIQLFAAQETWKNCHFFTRPNVNVRFLPFY